MDHSNSVITVGCRRKQRKLRNEKMNDKHDVDIYICGSSEESDKIVTQTVGTMYHMDGKIHILYYERFEGDLEQTKNHLVFDGNQIRLTKNGPVMTIMIFDKNMNHNTQYHTPHGSLPITVHTDSIQVTELENGMNVLIDYELSYGDDQPFKTQINLKARYKEDGLLIT